MTSAVLDQSRTTLWRPLWFVGAALLLFLAYNAPRYYHEINGKPHLQFALIVPLGAAALFWVRQPKVNAWPVGPNAFSAALAFLAILLAFDSFLLSGSLPWILAVLLAVLAGIHAWGGWTLVRELWPLWGFLWLMVPPPFGLDDKLIQGLQIWVSHAAGYVLDAARVYHHLEGNVIRIADGQDLFVAEACSGVNSLFATFVVLVFSMLFFRRSWPHILCLFALGFCAVLAVNVFRVAALTWIHNYDPSWGKFVDQEPWHSLFGMLCFAMLILVLVSCDSLLFLIKESTLALLPTSWGARLSPPPEVVDDEPSTDSGGRSPAPAVPAPAGPPPRGSGWCYALGSLALVLAALQFSVGAWLITHPAPDLIFSDREDPLPDLLGELGPRLPSNWDGWLLVGRNEMDGHEMNTKFSTAWQYRRGHEEMTVFVHRPYLDWHPLQICYNGTGWKVKNITNGLLNSEAGAQGPPGSCYVSFDIEKEDQGRFVLAFSYFDVNNREFVEPEIRLQSLTLPERLERAFTRRIAALQRLWTTQRQPMRTVVMVVQIRTTRGAESTDKAEAMQRLADGLVKMFGPLFDPGSPAPAPKPAVAAGPAGPADTQARRAGHE